MTQLNLLLAEDDPNWRSLGAKALRALGYGVEEAADGKEAISALSSGRYPHQAVISDLHMRGYNGDMILEYLLNNQANIPFVISSGTLADDAKKILAEGVPSVKLIGKEDFLDPESLRGKLEDILRSPAHNHPSPDYLSALKRAKDSITAIPEILVEANRIKGRIFSLIDRFGQDLGEDYLLLKEFQYHGRTPADIIANLHDLKNMLTGMAHNRYKHNELVHRQLLRISDDIIQVINSPKEDSMNLGEIVARLTNNFGRIYTNISIQTDIPEKLRIKNPSLYSKVLYFLIENAAIAALESNSNDVRIGYDEKTQSLQIINAGMFPAESLLPNGKPYSGIKSTREFGTGFGIKNCVQSLEEIGQGLTYLNEDGWVYTNIGLSLSESTPKLNGRNIQKPKVLFSEYDYSHPRLTGIESVISLLNPNFEYVWDPKLNQSPSLIKELKLEEFFLVICHPDSAVFNNSSNLSVLLSPEVLSRMPNARYGFITATPRRNLNGLISAMYDGAELDIEIKTHAEPGKPGLKRGGILPYVDFLERGLPSSDQLNILIERSYQKYMAAAKIPS